MVRGRTRSRRVVVIGFGPVAARLVDELRPAVRDHRLQLLVVGAEPVPAYNRIMVGELALGRTDPELMIMADVAELEAYGVRLRLGATVIKIDREHRYVTLDDGDQYAYDTLIFATGAAARIPRLAGLPYRSGEDQELPDGVTALRDLADADRLARLARPGQRLVVLGGGVLGMELALAAAEGAVHTSLVHSGRVPMERNLDRTAAAIVSRHLRGQGIEVVAEATALAVRLQHGRFAALVLSDGRQVPADGLVLCCGATPRTRLAEESGLACASGILVDHELRSINDADSYAIGDCAQVRCTDRDCPRCKTAGSPGGLIGPGWAQASWLAEQLLADLDHDHRSRRGSETGDPVTIVKAPGLSVVSAGVVDADPLECLLSGADLRVAQWSDPDQGRYAKMITRDGRLAGLICVGLPRTAAELTLLYERQAELPCDRSALLRHDGPDQLSGSDPFAPDATVCRCNGVSAGQITDAIIEGHNDVAAIGRTTRAGTGCGTCKDRIRELLRNAPEVAVG